MKRIGDIMESVKKNVVAVNKSTQSMKNDGHNVVIILGKTRHCMSNCMMEN